jgi:hypothetical protein
MGTISFRHITEFSNIALSTLIEAIDADAKVDIKDIWNILCVSALTEIPWNLLSVICEIPHMEEELAEFMEHDEDEFELVLDIMGRTNEYEETRFDHICSMADGFMWDAGNFSPTLELVVTCYMYTDKYLAIKEYCDPDNSVVVSKLLREMFENTPAVLKNSNIIDTKKAKYWGML